MLRTAPLILALFTAISLGGTAQDAPQPQAIADQIASEQPTTTPEVKFPLRVPLTEIPIYQVNNRNVVEVPVANYTLNLVLDTGASKTALFQSEDYEFNDLARVGSSEILFPALDEKVTGSILEPLNVLFGDYSFTVEAPLLIAKRPPIGDRLNFAFDGVLGQDFFHRFVVEIDPDEQIMRLYPPESDIGRRFPRRIGLTLRDNAPYIEFKDKMPWELRESDKSMLLDTGYPGVMVVWNHDHFNSAAGRKRADELRAKNRGVFTKATFKLGGVRFLLAPIFIAPNVPQQAGERDGIIGNNVLNAHHHIIDFPNGAVYMKKRAVTFNKIDGAFYVPNREGYIYKRFERTEAIMKHSLGNDD